MKTDMANPFFNQHTLRIISLWFREAITASDLFLIMVICMFCFNWLIKKSCLNSQLNDLYDLKGLIWNSPVHTPLSDTIGVLQGCPMTPIIFKLSIDILARILPAIPLTDLESSHKLCVIFVLQSMLSEWAHRGTKYEIAEMLILRIWYKLQNQITE